MRKLIYMASILLLIAVTSCDDSFDPKSEFETKYVLSSIVQANTLGNDVTIDAYLTKLYDVDGTNPYTNSDDPAIEGAVIQLLHRNNIYDLAMVKVPNGNPRYNTDMVKYTASFTSPRPGDSLRIRAILPDGTFLTSGIQLPRSLHFDLNYPYVRGFTSNIDKSYFGDALRYEWRGSLEEIYFPELRLFYQVNIDGQWVSRTRDMPTEILGNGKEVYTEYVYDFDIGYKYSAIDKVIESLGDTLSDKSNIKLVKLYFKLTSLERNLANYYSSTNGFLDSYSIRLDEEVYNNISGGLGIFGGALAFEYDLLFDPTYVISFGYSN